MRRSVFVVVLLCAMGAGWGAPSLKKTSRKRPKTATMKAPKGFKAVKLPKGLHTRPPAERWWEGADPCPDGATLEETTEGDWVYHQCKDADGRDHGPYTHVAADGHIGADGWRKHGIDHGVQRVFWDNGALTEQITFVDGERQGDATESREHGPYKDGERHGRWDLPVDGGTVARGYFVKGKRQGTWYGVTTRDGAEIVIARASFAADALDSDAVWWTEAGDLLATIADDPIYKERNVQFYGHGKPTLKATCDEDLPIYFRQVLRGVEIECRYYAKLAADFGNTPGDLAEQKTASDSLTCPAVSTSFSSLCTANVLDPYTVASSMRSGW